MIKLLRVTVDNKLSFESHLDLICKMINKKVHVLARVSRFVSKKKLRVIMKPFIMSQFSYCHLVWMCHRRTLNNKINKFHQRALRIVYDDRKSTFEEMLNIEKSVTMHPRNLKGCRW